MIWNGFAIFWKFDEFPHLLWRLSSLISSINTHLSISVGFLHLLRRLNSLMSSLYINLSFSVDFPHLLQPFSSLMSSLYTHLFLSLEFPHLFKRLNSLMSSTTPIFPFPWIYCLVKTLLGYKVLINIPDTNWSIAKNLPWFWIPEILFGTSLSSSFRFPDLYLRAPVPSLSY